MSSEVVEMLFSKLSAWLYRISKPVVLFSVTIIFAFFVILVLPAQAGESLEVTGSPLSPDTMLFYNAEKLYDLADLYGLDGRIYYVQSRITFDIIWPIAYVTFLFVAISFCLNSWRPNSKWRWLNLVPLAGFVFDLLENTTVSIVMARYPASSDFFAFLAPLFTTLKWTMMLGSVVILLIGAGRVLLKTLQAVAHKKDLE